MEHKFRPEEPPNLHQMAKGMFEVTLVLLLVFVQAQKTKLKTCFQMLF